MSGSGRMLEDLTATERTVLALAATGHSNLEIAAHLVVSEDTVKTHVAHILAKTHTPNRVEAGRVLGLPHALAVLSEKVPAMACCAWLNPSAPA